MQHACQLSLAIRASNMRAATDRDECVPIRKPAVVRKSPFGDRGQGMRGHRLAKALKIGRTSVYRVLGASAS
jgi:hypothetical protein